jgi:hypothetical protein
MLGMTKRQFLKRSKKSLNETGTLLLLLKDTMNKINQEKISNEEASKQINNIRIEVESIFSQFEKNDPPSRCTPLKGRILHVLIILHESVIATLESLTAARKENEEKSRNKWNESNHILEEFSKDFHPICDDVNSFLVKKQKKEN